MELPDLEIRVKNDVLYEAIKFFVGLCRAAGVLPIQQEFNSFVAITGRLLNLFAIGDNGEGARTVQVFRRDKCIWVIRGAI